jgi:SpoIIAA-like
MFTPIENLPAGAIGFVANGHVTQDDRSTVLEPTIEWALEIGGRVRLLYVTGSDFAGYEPGGFFDDAVFGTRHFTDFDRIAFVADDGPFNRAVLAMEGLMPARLRVFPANAVNVAKAWLAE